MNILLSTFLAAALASASPAPAAVVHIRDFAYHSTPTTIHVGDTVQFVNDDGDAHTVTASDKSFDSGGLDSHETWTHTFTTAGTYSYFCALHPYMKAVIVVLPAQPQAGATQPQAGATQPQAGATQPQVGAK